VTIHHILVQGKLKAEVDIVSSLDEQARPKPHFRKAILLLKCMILQISKIWRVDNQIKRTELDAADYYINKEECLDWAWAENNIYDGLTMTTPPTIDSLKPEQ